MKKVLFILLLITIMFCLGFVIYTNIIFNDNIPILAYHDVIENPVNDTDISIENFEKQMKYLYNHNYKTLSLDEFYEWKSGKNISGKKIVLTFDDGKESFYTNVIPILEKYNFKAVVFVIDSSTNNKTYMSIEQLNDIRKNHNNMDIQAHSYNLHLMDLAISNDYNIYNEDMKKTKENNYSYYAYPFGISSENYVKALKDNNYKLAFLYSPSKWSNKNQDNYLINRIPIYKSNSLFKFIIKVSFKI